MAKRNIKNLRIMRALMAHPQGELTKYRIAQIAGCSVPWVIEFLRKLEKEGITKKTKLLNRDKLIAYYVESIPKATYFECYVQNPLQFLKGSSLPYALTTYGAENLTSHHLFPTRYDIYIRKDDSDAWKHLIAKEGLLGKGNLRIIPTHDNAIFSEGRKVKGVQLVSLPQLMIDLKKEGGVAEEAFAMLVKNV
ncbi:hypothetical protein A3A67_00750 [Candidatus Peribacteria bacterium RIFCSPLOWO2_01_FULL_51_18]|nr:MAG: hypothetical protein A3A67_00750 [Candidatus Peribacteria bacterium RIFCSPLOWO2_01_FULL_51_18]HLD78942.1 hypothetical protein [Candidatus Nanoarchaeia archaeon]